MSVPLAALAGRGWDAVVIGAGPAGTMVATLMARRGLAVVLVDRANFPRPKVCGGCLNRAALAALEAAGLGRLPAELGASRLTQLQLFSRRRHATIPLHEGAGISRQALDAELASAAVKAGATFVDGTRAQAGVPVESYRPVHLVRGEEEATLRASIVVAASGLGPLPAADAHHFPPLPLEGARIGAGAATPLAPAQVPPQTIVMVCETGGYVGLVRVEGGALNVGAAFDAAFVQRSGGLGEAAAALVEAGGLSLAELLRSLRWRGTPALTFRRRCLARERLFILGDAGGYVEPFTGEGMAWALAGAWALAPLVVAAARRWDEHLPGLWQHEYARRIGRRQQLCRAVAAALRRPALVAAVVTLLRLVPPLALPAVAAVNAPPRLPAAP